MSVFFIAPSFGDRINRIPKIGKYICLEDTKIKGYIIYIKSNKDLLIEQRIARGNKKGFNESVDPFNLSDTFWNDMNTYNINLFAIYCPNGLILESNLDELFKQTPISVRPDKTTDIIPNTVYSIMK